MTDRDMTDGHMSAAGVSELRRGFACSCCGVLAVLVLVCPRTARAQDSDTLPTLDEGAPVAAPEAPPVAPPVIRLEAPAPSARRPLLPIRARRRLALLGEVGWNGIAGFGPNLVFHLDPRFSFDLGAGLSLLGWKVGARARYNFLVGPVTPFIGLAAMGAAGFGDSPIPINDNNDPTHETVNIKVLPSAWCQTVAGVDWTSEHGFTLLGTAGYAFLLSHDPVEVTSGVPTKDEERAFDIAFRSNIVATIALGYSFR
ncbi:MAG TPA: hypothetical protein VGL19_03730 [Polyangiaceae bacterium]|jgi:hypothetical protein